MNGQLLSGRPIGRTSFHTVEIVLYKEHQLAAGHFQRMPPLWVDKCKIYTWVLSLLCQVVVGHTPTPTASQGMSIGWGGCSSVAPVVTGSGSPAPIINLSLRTPSPVLNGSLLLYNDYCWVHQASQLVGSDHLPLSFCVLWWRYCFY